MLSLDDGKAFLKLARESVRTSFSKQELKIDKGLIKKFSEKQGVFVTINKNKELRGCIGFPEPTYPLYDAIVKGSRSAAFEDPRFPSLEQNELDDVEFEISVLTVPELIDVKEPEEYLKKIKIGEDGLIIRGMLGSGLLLPQVFPEWKADEKKALEMTCSKAGLPADCWKDRSNRIFKFQAQIFAEEDSKVVEKRL